VDVAVDIRKDSPTYGEHFSIRLSGDNQLIFWIPPGFLHGFLTLENNTIFTYKVTSLYDKSSEIGVLWNDNDLRINWGMDEQEIILSEKDLLLPAFKDFNSPF
jgi:dTDP-4-dehydrorhamnose 3,5-epimerase